MIESWLRLANLQLPVRLAVALLEHYGGPDALFEASPDDVACAADGAARFAGRLADPAYAPTRAQLDAVERLGIRLIAWRDPDYPPPLAQIPDPPPVLFVRGEVADEDRFAVALVGSRRSTPYGRTVTARLARDLARAGLTVVSGGALGIDSAAHRATLEAGGRTLVVLGCGLDVPYPRENQEMFEEVVRRGRGAVLTEFPPGAQPEPWRFPQRNRVISGLSMGVVVVEAGTRSGALLTASLAGEQGRDVLAVPGNVDREASRGTNALIRDGASLVEEVGDVLRALGILALEAPPGPPAVGPRSADLPEEQRRLLACLSLTPRHIDSIAAELGVVGPDAGVQLTMLELAGLVRRLPGNSYVRAL